MFPFSCASVAVAFAFFIFRSSAAVVGEYTPLFMKQLGFTAVFIGLSPLLGLVTQIVGTPLIGFLADKLRSRKLFLFVSLLIVIPNTALFVTARHFNQPCHISTGNSSFGNGTMTRNIAFGKPSVTSENTRGGSTYSLTNKSSPSLEKNTTLDEIASKFNVNRSAKFHQTGPLDQLTTKRSLNCFLIIVFLRAIYELLKRLTLNFLTVATMTHLQNDKTKFGYYACWGEIGAGMSLFLVGILVSQVRHFHCGELLPSYFISFLCAAGFQCFTLVSLPWLKFEYLERRVVNFAEVKKIIWNPHYLLMLLICAHGGLCTSFQFRWEFWYMENLGATPLVIAVGGLIRRPIVAVWFLLSRSIIDRLGELYVIAISLFTFAVSFAALAFAQKPWQVIVFDIFQSIGYVLIYSSLVIHFSKVGSKASSAAIQGKVFSILAWSKF